MGPRRSIDKSSHSAVQAQHANLCKGDILGNKPIEAVVNKPIDVTGKVEAELKGTAVITVQAAAGTQVLNTTSSRNIRVQGGGGLGTAMRESSPGGRGGV